jgi:membrane protein DedA with SNARE-associated domain
MTDWVTSLVESIGYVGIALLMAVEMWVAVISSEMVMTFSGFAARNGDLSLTGAIAAGVAGTQVGAMTLYGASRFLPEDRVRSFLARNGAWLGIDEDALRGLEATFRRNEAKAVVLGRLLPGLRGIIAIPAGMLGMRAWLFFACTFVGATFWTAVLAGLGYALGTQYELVDRYSTVLTVAFVALVVGLVVWRAVKVRRARHA